MAGGIVIYQAAKSYGLGPYSSAYFYVNVEGYDSPDGIKANWMLQGVYGPDPKVAQALKRYYHLPVRTGTAKIDATSDATRYTGIIDGHTIVTAETRGGACEGAALFEHYPAFDAKTGQIVLLPIPEIGDWCVAELKSLDVRPPAGDAFAAFKVKSVKHAGEFKNWSFSFAAPRSLGKP